MLTFLGYYKSGRICVLMFFNMLILHSSSAYGQFSNSGFEKKLRKQYEEDIKSDEYKDLHNYVKQGTIVFKNTSEVFGDYFKQYKIVIVNYGLKSDAINSFPKLYFFDTERKNVVHFNSASEFFSVINSSSKTLENLDKCYVYLYAYINTIARFSMGITSPEKFNEQLYKKTVFYNNPKLQTFFKNDARLTGNIPLRVKVSDDTILKGTDSSTKKRIVIYLYKYSRLEEYYNRTYDYTYQYTFLFDKEDHLYQVNEDLYD